MPYLAVVARHVDRPTLVTHSSETINGKITIGSVIPTSDWSFAHCTSWASQCPGMPDDHEHIFPATCPVHDLPEERFDPTCSTRSSTRPRSPTFSASASPHSATSARSSTTRRADDFGTPNPVAGASLGDRPRRLAVGQLHARSHLPRHEPGRGATASCTKAPWPHHRRPPRRRSIVRWGQPDGVLELYQLGQRRPAMVGRLGRDPVRNLPARSILDRCTCTGTCPKVIEHFGGSEVFALKMTHGMGRALPPTPTSR